MADDDDSVPRGRRSRAERLDYELAFERACRRIDIENYLVHAAETDRRGFLKLFARKIPQQISAQVDHEITVKVVKQVGEKEVLLSVKGPQDARTGEQLPMVPATIDHATLAAANDDDEDDG